MAGEGKKAIPQAIPQAANGWGRNNQWATGGAPRKQHGDRWQAFKRHNNPDEGWKTVGPRKRSRQNPKTAGIYDGSRRGNQWSGQAKMSGKKVYSSEETQRAYAKAFNEGRCFRCLARDHKKWQCREPVRCFKCDGLGHSSGRCTFKKPEVDKRQVDAKGKATEIAVKQRSNHTYAQIVQPPSTKPLVRAEKMEPFLNVRPAETQVFFPPREGLRPQNQYLHTTGMVVMVEGEPAPDIPHILARRLAGMHGWMPADYEVLPAEPTDDAPFVLHCPSEASLRNVVWESPYDIRPGVQVGVIAWEPDWHMVYEPPPYQAWVRLFGIPHQALNNVDIRQIAIPLGRVTTILPYGRAAGHYRYVTIRLACEDPEGLSRTLKYHEGDKTAGIRVDLLGWREWQEGPYPVPHNAWGEQQQQNQLHPHIPPPPRTPSSTTNGSHGDGSSGGSHSVNQLSRAVGTQVKAWKVKPKIKQRWVRKKHQTTPKVTPNQEEGHKVLTPKATHVLGDRGQVKCCRGQFQIFRDGRAIIHLSLDLLISPMMSTRIDGGIKCMVLCADKGNETRKVETKRLNISLWKDKEIGKVNVQVQQKDLDCLTGFLTRAQMNTNQVGKGGHVKGRTMLSYTPCDKQAQESPYLMGQEEEVPDDDFLNYMGLEGYARRKKENKMGRIELPEMAQLEPSHQDLDHPPGFPEPKYKVPVAPRRSTRISAKKKKNEAAPKQPTPPKMKLFFEERADPIDAELAIKLMKESGAVITDRVSAMIKEASTIEAGKKKETLHQAQLKCILSGEGEGEEGHFLHV